jgi:hypothetical protein
MRSALRESLIKLEQEARAVGRADLAEHVEGAWLLLESISKAVARARTQRRRQSQDERRPPRQSADWPSEEG